MSNLGTLGSMYIDLRAGLANFESDIGRAVRLAEKEAERVAKQSAKIAAAASAMFVAQGTAFSLMVKRQIDTADSMGKVAQATGLQIEQLSRLDYAARFGGVEDLGRQLQVLHKNTILASQGTGTQAAAFRALGVEVRDANGQIKTGDALLLELSDAFQKHEDGAAKSAAAQALFGDGAAKMIPLLNGGSQSLRELMTEAERFGLVVDANTSANAAKLNDNLFRMQAAFHGVANRVAAGLLPTMIDLSDQFVQYTTDAETAERATRWVDASVKGLIVTGIAVKSTFQAVGTMIGGVLAAASRVGDDLSWKSFLHPALLLNDLSKSAPAAAEILGNAYSDARASVSEDIEAIMKVIDAGQKDMQRLAEQGQAPATLGKSLVFNPREKTGEIDEAAGRALQQRIRQMETLQQQARQLAESLRTPEERWTAQIAKIDEYYNAVDSLGQPILSAEERTRALTAANDEYYRSLDALEGKGAETFNQMSVYADQAARNMQSALADFFFDPFSDGLEGLARSFTNVLRRMAAEMAASEVFRWLGGMGFSAGSMFAPTPMGGGGYGGLDYGVDPGSISFGGGRAKGGDIQPNRWYMVGEEGPEPFYSGVAGTVVPFKDSGAAGRGGNVVVQIYGAEGDSRVERDRGPNGDELVRVFLNEAAKSVSERGVLGQAITSTYLLQHKAA
jgi:hypothetical protein